MTKSATTMSAPGSSSGRGQRMRLRLTVSQVVKAIKKLSNQRGYTLTSIRKSLCRDVGKFSNDQINWMLHRAIQAGRVKEIIEDRFRLPRHSHPASHVSSHAATQASASRESRSRPSGSHTTTGSKRSQKPKFILQVIPDKRVKRNRRVLPTTQPSRRNNSRQRGQQKKEQPKHKHLRQYRRRHCMHKEAAAASDESSAENDENDCNVGAGDGDADDANAPHSEEMSGADGREQMETPSDNTIAQPVAGREAI